jgi:hypothetical protein
MHGNDQMRFAMAIHMLQKSNPATRRGMNSRRGTTRRHMPRAEPSNDRQVTSERVRG